MLFDQFLKIVFWLLINYRDPTPPSTPEHVRDAGRQDDHEECERLMESPQNCRVPDPLPVNQQFNYLHPANLAQMRDNLPPLIPVGQRGRWRQPPAAPAFVLAPAPAPDPPLYQYISADLAQQVAALPPLQQRGRGRGRRCDNPAPAPAPVNFEEIAVQYAALPHVCFFLKYFFYNAKVIN